MLRPALALAASLVVTTSVQATAAPPTVLVGCATEHRIVRFEAGSGAPIDHFVATGISPLVECIAMTLGPDGNLYATSRGNNSVLKYDGRTGQFLGTFVPSGSGGLGIPYELEFGPDGHLYVTSRANNAVLKYHGTTGVFLGNAVPPGAAGLNAPWDLVFDTDGSLLVSGQSSGKIFRFNPQSGALIEVVLSNGQGGLLYPTGMALGDDGRLYVSSYGNDRIVVLDPLLGPSTLVPAGTTPLDGPSDIVIAPDNTLLVAYPLSGGGVLRFDQAGNYLGPFVPSGAGAVGATPISLVVLQPGCEADLTGSSDPNSPAYGVPDGDTDGDDFFYFLDRFSEGCP